MNKLTPWFPPEIKPIRNGVYMASQWCTPDVYRYWDGELWSYFGVSPADCINQKDHISASQSLAWRGLSRKPK